ncbi:MAG TPA: tetratricopeptide repeat protein [Deltaproteobacteria bacterium]|nr:tetratricopeptide repeat protein [Deltaproteobacteria bacterium]
MKKYLSSVIAIILAMSLAGCGAMTREMNLIRAEMKLSTRQYEDSIPFYKAYLAENPDSPDARSRLGFAYLKIGKLDDSIREMETVLSKDGGNSYAILYLGIAYLNKGDYGKTIDVWQRYRSKNEPLVEQEIKRLLTLVQLAESQRLAKEALAHEKKLQVAGLDKDAVAVCYYKDLSPDKSLRAFQKALTAMVITDMSRVKSLNIVERTRLQALFQEMELGQTGVVDEKTAPRVGRLVGAENLVVGTLALGSIQASTSIISATKGKVFGSSTVEVSQDQFYDLPKHIVMNFAKIKGINLSQAEREALEVPHTKVYKAFIYYGMALDALDAGKWEDARNLFSKALELDPYFRLASDGASSSPGDAAPTPDAIAAMSPSELADTMDSLVSSAQEAQAEADQAAADAKSGGSGGGH